MTERKRGESLSMNLKSKSLIFRGEPASWNLKNLEDLQKEGCAPAKQSRVELMSLGHIAGKKIKKDNSFWRIFQGMEISTVSRRAERKEHQRQCESSKNGKKQTGMSCRERTTTIKGEKRRSQSYRLGVEAISSRKVVRGRVVDGHHVTVEGKKTEKYRPTKRSPGSRLRRERGGEKSL